MKLQLSQLQSLRKKYYLMQYDLCRYIGVSDVAYRTWEQRVRRPNEAHYKRLLEIFEILDAYVDEISSRESAIQVLDRELGEDE